MNKRIKQLRNIKGLNQTDFGKGIGVCRKVVWELETGKTEPNDNIKQRLCYAFNVRPEWLENGTGLMLEPHTESEEQAELKSKTMLRFIADIAEATNGMKRILGGE